MNWVKLSIVILLVVLLTAGCTDFSPSLPFVSTPIPTPTPTQSDYDTIKKMYVTKTPTPTPKPTESLEQRNVRISKEIVETYHETHTYSLPDLYVCGDMSCDVWDMLKTQGIPAKIFVGNVNIDISEIKDANHAWVVAEVAPDTWIALETTGGFLVCSDTKYCAVDNPRYYKGWIYDNPREYKEAIEKLKHPCGEGFVLGSDNLCHPTCGGSTYCTGNSVCVNGKCMGCEPGYILGSDLKCHKPCGSPTSYCSGDSICVDGVCKGCEPGYILGSDLKCHQPCGSTTTYCLGNSICVNGKCIG